MIDFNLEEQQKLDITDPEIIKQVDNMYVDFYLEDDMFELEGQFFTVDGELYIEVHDAVMHILEMSGKELKVGAYGNLFTATRPDGHNFMMEINRIYYKLEDPSPAELQKLHEEKNINTFFLKLTDVMVVYKPEDKKWQITKNKINMYYIGDRTEYDTLEELFKDNADDVQGLWQAVIYEAYEDESDYTFKF